MAWNGELIVSSVNAVADALQCQRVASESSAWSLLRSSNAPAIAAVFRSVFDGQRRSVTGTEFVEELNPLLVELREEGFDLPRNAVGYISDWVKAGFLIRRSPQGMREEFYELSTDAITALDYISVLLKPRKSATRSRLSTVAERLTSLAIDTDPDESHVLARLEEEKKQIERRIALVQERGVDVISEDEALEQVENILSLVADIPSDFARVRQATEELDQNLREQILVDELSAAEVLDNVFRGVDVIQDSDEGKSFNGFYELLFDREQSTRLESTLESILSRPFVEDLSTDQRAELRWLLRNLEEHSDEVHNSMTSLARSLRRFVQSREVESQQALASAINHAQALALRLGHQVNPSTKIGVDLELTSRHPSSMSTWVLHDPADFHIEGDMEVAPADVANLAELQARVRDSEIDWAELQSNIVSVLTQHQIATVGDVLKTHPATQGLASVVGVLKLAMQHGERIGGTEYVTWDTSQDPQYDGGADTTRTKRAKVVRYRFTPKSLAELGQDQRHVRLVPVSETATKGMHTDG